MSEPRPATCHALVFRDVRERLRLAEAVAALRGELGEAQSYPNPDPIVSALIRAGELQCALEDENHPQAKNIIEELKFVHPKRKV